MDDRIYNALKDLKLGGIVDIEKNIQLFKIYQNWRCTNKISGLKPNDIEKFGELHNIIESKPVLWLDEEINKSKTIIIDLQNRNIKTRGDFINEHKRIINCKKKAYIESPLWKISEFPKEFGEIDNELHKYPELYNALKNLKLGGIADIETNIRIFKIYFKSLRGEQIPGGPGGLIKGPDDNKKYNELRNIIKSKPILWLDEDIKKSETKIKNLQEEILEIGKRNTQGSLWVAGGFRYRPIIEGIYGRNTRREDGIIDVDFEKAIFQHKEQPNLNTNDEAI